MLGTSHEGEDEGGESAEMGGSVLVGGSGRRAEFRSKSNDRGMALIEWPWPHRPASQYFLEGPSHSAFLSRSPTWGCNVRGRFPLLLRLCLSLTTRPV